MVSSPALMLPKHPGLWINHMRISGCILRLTRRGASPLVRHRRGLHVAVI